MSSNVFMNNQLERIADYIDAGKAGGGSLTVNLSGVGDMTGATAGTAGTHGLVPAPAAGDQDKTLHGDGTWRAETAVLPQVFGSSSGSVITLTDAADYVASDLVINIEPVQSGSGDPSPDNIRPISGWTGCNVTVSPTQDAEDGTTYSITFPSEAGTVYGGTLYVTNGTLTVTMAEVDLGTLTWNYSTIQRFFFANLNDLKIDATNLICDRYIYVEKSWANMQNGEFGKVKISNQIRFHNDNYETPADFKIAMSGVQFVYPLAEPVTYQLTPTEVQMLLGTNNLWADTGDVLTLEYIKADYNDLMQAVPKMKMPDYSAVIASGTYNQPGTVYTATQDCFIYLEYSYIGMPCYIDVDGATVARLWTSNGQSQSGSLIPLKAGNVVTSHGGNDTLPYAVYPII